MCAGVRVPAGFHVTSTHSLSTVKTAAHSFRADRGSSLPLAEPSKERAPGHFVLPHGCMLLPDGSLLLPDKSILPLDDRKMTKAAKEAAAKASAGGLTAPRQHLPHGSMYHTAACTYPPVSTTALTDNLIPVRGRGAILQPDGRMRLTKAARKAIRQAARREEMALLALQAPPHGASASAVAAATERRTPGASTLRAGAAEFVPGSLPEIPEWADEPATKIFNLQELSAQTVALRDGELPRPPDWADDGAASVCASEASYFTARWLPNDLA